MTIPTDNPSKIVLTNPTPADIDSLRAEQEKRGYHVMRQEENQQGLERTITFVFILKSARTWPQPE
jgi:hypothetical protein